MKTNLIIPALAAVLGLALAGAPLTTKAQTTPAPAAATTTPAAAPAPASSKKKSDYVEYKGTITAMDAKSMTVMTAKGSMTLMVDESTKFMVSKKKAAMTDFAVGDKVTGSYMTMEDGTFMAHSIHKKQGTK